MLHGNFPDWDNLYEKNNVETMPWYSKDLDSDLKNELTKRNLTKGRFLDLGTGPDTQAIELSKMGFSVTGTDLSENAIKKAQKLGSDVEFIVDDILNSKLKENSLDYVLDRGCFHVLSPEKRHEYVRQVKNILGTSGILFLKCFSIKEPREYGPYRFSEQNIRQLFRNDFKIESIIESVYHGRLEVFPKTLFVVMEKIS
jgi:ubiquinone/menaquinone biosynthesis C-methylase UbiE